MRVGLEDNIIYSVENGKKIIGTNEQFVKRAAELAKIAGRGIATAEEARKLLGITISDSKTAVIELRHRRGEDFSPLQCLMSFLG